MRGQLDTAIGMILTLAIVAAVLVLATWGFFQLASITSDGAYDRVYEVLSSTAAGHTSYGSLGIARINAPEPFCVFNTSVESDFECAPGYSGHEVCDAAGLDSYWESAGPEDGNVVFRSGLNERVGLIAPRNGRFSCFDAGSSVVFFEGAGQYATVSPMRELESFTLTHSSLSDTISVATFTSSSHRDAEAELFYVYTQGAPDGNYVGSIDGDTVAVTVDSGSVENINLAGLDLETPQAGTD